MSLHTLLSSINLENNQAKEINHSEYSPEWTVKAYDASPTKIIGIKLTFAGLIAVVWGVASWTWQVNLEVDKFAVEATAVILTTILLFLFKFVMQKSVFHYTLHSTHGQYRYNRYQYNNTEILLQYFAIGLFSLYIIIALYMESLIAIFLGAAYLQASSLFNLMSWKNAKPQIITSAPWTQFDTMLIDRKHNFIVLSTEKIAHDFKLYFIEETHLDRHIAYLKSVLRPNIRHIDKK
ncbi:hypothetical protein [uncultured Pseudomonas sp.]|uniref:hypothetical protein n=1 Tax=uncultured Pseudomonas sp. TaxID=114707 RepID=UPI0025D2DC5C|nr:hypothetical protein [uncultured Pseudomonas sp.]